jgi:hypothetical protein
MKNLLRKEFLLSSNPQLIIFLFFGALVVIPSWPSMVAMIYVLGGFATIFPRALADQDIQYTAMLPIRKSDVVVGKGVYVVLLELASLLFSIPFALVKILAIDPALNKVAEANSDYGNVTFTLATEPGLGAYGYVLLAFGIFNLILFPWYYKNPAKVNIPPLIALLGAGATLGLGIGLGYMSFELTGASSANWLFWLSESLTLALGLLAFVLLTIIALKKACKNFDKIDL